MEEAQKSSKELRQLVLKSLDNDEQLAKRLDELTKQGVPYTSSYHRSSAASRNLNVRDGLDWCPTIDLGKRESPKSSIFGFGFEKDLKTARVYRRIANRCSVLSFPSSTGQSQGWSCLSDISLSQVSNISVLALPISATELYDGGQYLVDTSSDGMQSLSHPWLSLIRNVGCAEADLSWPASRIINWMREQVLDDSLITDFLAHELSGQEILHLDYDHMTRCAKGVSKQAILWNWIQQLQSAILDEVLQHRHGEYGINFFDFGVKASKDSTSDVASQTVAESSMTINKDNIRNGTAITRHSPITPNAIDGNQCAYNLVSEVGIIADNQMSTILSQEATLYEDRFDTDDDLLVDWGSVDSVMVLKQAIEAATRLAALPPRERLNGLQE